MNPPTVVNRLIPSGVRLYLERLPGNRVQTDLIDASGEQFSAWRKSSPIDYAMEALAHELARHLKIHRTDVDINETYGSEVRGKRQFRLIAHPQGKPKEATDALAAFRQWHESGSCPSIETPVYIDIECTSQT